MLSNNVHSGIIQTFNFAENGRHLSNQNYKSCVRQEKGRCSIQYEPCDSNSFRIGPNAMMATNMPGMMMGGMIPGAINMGMMPGYGGSMGGFPVMGIVPGMGGKSDKIERKFKIIFGLS